MINFYSHSILILLFFVQRIWGQSTATWGTYVPDPDVPVYPSGMPTDASNGKNFAVWGVLEKMAIGASSGVQTYYLDYDADYDSWSEGALITLSDYPTFHPAPGYGASVDGAGSVSTLDILAIGATSTAAGHGIVQIVKDSRSIWTTMQILQAPIPQATDSFGSDVSLDPFNPRKLLVGASGAGYQGLTNAGTAYVFQSSPTAKYWTVTQQLFPSSPASSATYGSQVSMMEKFAAVTAPGSCDVYLYAEQLPPPPPPPCIRSFERDAASSTSTDQSIDSFDKFIYADIVTPKTLQWSEQQVLHFDCDGINTISVSVYENSLAIGVPGVDDDVLDGDAFDEDNIGRVYTYEAYTVSYKCNEDITTSSLDLKPGHGVEARKEMIYNWRKYYNEISSFYGTEDAECPPPPEPMCELVKWTQTSALASPNGDVDNTAFGQQVDIYEDTMVVSSDSSGIGELFLYKKVTSTNPDTWTYVGPSYFGTTDLGAAVQAINNDVYALHDGSAEVYRYTSDGEWKCLIIEMGDQFGDGWNGADILITSPDGRQERYHKDCDDFQTASSNPRTYRWCPDQHCDTDDSHDHHDNIYTIEIPDALNIPFHWEIYWSVTTESNNEKVIATAATKMTFSWNCYDLSMNLLSASLIHDITEACHSCPGPPTPEPTPGKAGPKQYLRHSKTSPTRQPTISQHPTVDSNIQTTWPYFRIDSTTSPTGWFNEYLIGTAYYISTDDGKHLLNTGSSCDTTAVDCWLNFPPEEGTFILRVGGAMNADVNEWEFCHRTGLTKAQLTFRADGDQSGIFDGCNPLYQFTADATFCSTYINHDIQVVGTLGVDGLDINYFNLNDFALIQSAFSKIFYSTHAIECQVSLGQSSGGSFGIVFSLFVPPGLVGVDPDMTIPTTILDTYNAAAEIISSALNAGTFDTYVMEAASEHMDEIGLMSSMMSEGKLGLVHFTLLDIHEGTQIHVSYSDDIFDDDTSSSTTSSSENGDASEFTDMYNRKFYFGVIMMVIVAAIVVVHYRRALEDDAEEDDPDALPDSSEKMPLNEQNTSSSSAQHVQGQDEASSSSDEDR